MPSTRPHEKIKGEFAFWGPPNSGKDWMIHSFARALTQYNDRRNARFDPHFEHRLMDDHERPLTTEAPDIINPTQPGMAADDLYYYERRGRSSPLTPAHRVSSHRHTVRVTNAAGGSTIDRIEDSVRDTLERAQCILLLLDPTSFQPGAYTRGQYQDWVKQFMDTLEPLEDGKVRYIAACLTKVDTLTTIREPAEQIRITFGAGMEQLLAGYDDRWSSELRMFAVSSFGFLSNKREANMGSDPRQLKDPNHWAPHNVEQPFFWLFEKLERSRLSAFSSSISRAFFENERRKLYIGYPGARL